VTLFASVAEKGNVFAKAISKYSPDGADPRTLDLMSILLKVHLMSCNWLYSPQQAPTKPAPQISRN
jgi:hypothetical protein